MTLVYHWIAALGEAFITEVLDLRKPPVGSQMDEGYCL